MVSKDGQPLVVQAVGLRAVDGPEAVPSKPAMKSSTVFDLGGLTGVMSTSVMILRLASEGLIRLDDRVVRYLQSFGTLGKSEITVRQLLNHTSGLISYLAFYDELIKEFGAAKPWSMSGKGGRDFVQNIIMRSSVRHKPGTKQIRSDIGLMVLGLIVEAVTGASLESSFRKLVGAPLSLKSTSYIDLDRVRRKDFVPATQLIAPTEYCSTRKRVLCGEPSDENCFLMGGISGHSGLFASATDINTINTELIKGYHGESELFTESATKEFWTVPEQITDASWSQGWEVPHRKNQMINSGLPTTARGGHGYTGCATWLEPQTRVAITFLSNRVHPSRTNKSVNALLPALFQRAFEVASS